MLRGRVCRVTRRPGFFRACALWLVQKPRAARAERRAPHGRRRAQNLLSARHDGLVLDGHRARLSLDASCLSLAVIATTGAGKAASFILLNLLSQDGRSIVATDTSGSLYSRTSADLQRRGYTAPFSLFVENNCQLLRPPISASAECGRRMAIAERTQPLQTCL